MQTDVRLVKWNVNIRDILRFKIRGDDVYETAKPTATILRHSFAETDMLVIAYPRKSYLKTELDAVVVLLEMIFLFSFLRAENFSTLLLTF